MKAPGAEGGHQGEKTHTADNRRDGGNEREERGRASVCRGSGGCGGVRDLRVNGREGNSGADCTRNAVRLSLAADGGELKERDIRWAEQ